MADCCCDFMPIIPMVHDCLLTIAIVVVNRRREWPKAVHMVFGLAGPSSLAKMT